MFSVIVNAVPTIGDKIMRVPYNVRKELENKGNLVLLAIVVGLDDLAYGFAKELYRFARKAHLI